jgi:hypothetical protein
MKYSYVAMGVMMAALPVGCEDSFTDTGNPGQAQLKLGDGWTIPLSEVYDGGPGKDGIPAISDPKFISVGEVDYLSDDDMVLGFMEEGEIRAYPHTILNWHEIVNDQVGEVYLSVTFCPLTGTGIGWDRDIDGEITTFGVSGLLYNTNLIPYDRLTDSHWSQIRGDCVEGELKRRQIDTYHLVETSWKTWKEMYPSSKVMSAETGYGRNYLVYPYAGYTLDDDFLLFPVSHSDSRLPNKKRVHGIVISGSARVYQFSEFGDQVIVKQDQFKGQDFVIVGNGKDNFIVSYHSDPGDGSVLEFKAVQDQYPVVMTDQECNGWDLFGLAVSGPRKGTRLKPSGGFNGYWLAFAAFFPGAQISGPAHF